VRERLEINGATAEEIDFLLSGEVDDEDQIVDGRRVELNAMTSAQFVEFVERKLTECEAHKVVPNRAALADAYAAFAQERRARPEVEALLRRLAAQPVEVPKDLEARVRILLADEPSLPWDAAVGRIVEEG
jgi:hypothetical protein